MLNYTIIWYIVLSSLISAVIISVFYKSHYFRQVGDGQTVRLSLLSFGGRLSSNVGDAIVESPAKTCYEVGAVQVSSAQYDIYDFRFAEHV